MVVGVLYLFLLDEMDSNNRVTAEIMSFNSVTKLDNDCSLHYKILLVFCFPRQRCWMLVFLVIVMGVVDVKKWELTLSIE